MSTAPPAPPDTAPLTAAQQAQWLLSQLAPAAGETALFAVPAALESPRLREAVRLLSLRHPALRTVFGAARRVPFQQVRAEPAVDFAEAELGAAAPAEVDARLAEETRRPFDLAQGPLFRVRLYRRSGADSLLMLRMPHLLTDAWSTAILLRDLLALYQHGAGAPLPEVERPFADFAREEAAMLAGPEGEQHLQFWRERLAGGPLTLQLREPRASAAPSPRATVAVLPAPPEIFPRLRAAARKHAMGPFTLVLSAWALVLHRRSGQEDLLIGCPVATRPPGFEETVGYFINLVPLRSRLSKGATFAEFLERTHDAQLEALEHAEYPFATLVDKLKVPRSPRPRLVQATVNYTAIYGRVHRARAAGLARDPASTGLQVELEAAPGVPARMLSTPEQEGPFELELLMTESGDELNPSIRYRVDLFDAGLIASLGAELFRVLDGAISRPEAKLEEL